MGKARHDKWVKLDMTVGKARRDKWVNLDMTVGKARHDKWVKLDVTGERDVSHDRGAIDEL